MKIDLPKIASKYGVDLEQLKIGIDDEKEHDTGDELDTVRSEMDLVKIALIHLREDPKYYTKLKKMTKEHKLNPINIIKEEISTKGMDYAAETIFETYKILSMQYIKEANDALEEAFKRLRISKKEDQRKLLEHVRENYGFDPLKAFMIKTNNGDDGDNYKQTDEKETNIDSFVEKIHDALESVQLTTNHMFSHNDRDSIIDYAIKQLDDGRSEKEILATIKKLYVQKFQNKGATT